MQALEIYRALADESRLRLVNILNAGRYNVQELTSILELAQPTISHHLKVLQAAQIVAAEREGTWAYYTLNANESALPAASITKNFLELAAIPAQSPLSYKFGTDLLAAHKLVDKRREESRRFFDSVARDWKSLRVQQQSHQTFMPKLLTQIEPGSILLELGCGSGALLEQILPRQAVTIGVDYSDAMLNEAKFNLGEKAAQVDFRLGYLEHLPLADKSVEQVVAYMVLHHVSSPLEVLRDCLRVLKPGGKVAIVDLSSHQDEQMRERFGDLWLGFDPPQFRAWGKKAGFCDIHLTLLGGRKKEAFLFTAIKGR